MIKWNSVTDNIDLHHKEIQYKFDLLDGIALRIKTYKLNSLNNTSYHIILNQHHILTDGWSMTIFAQRFSVLYKQIVNKTKEIQNIKHNNKKNYPTIRYIDYSVWNRNEFNQNIKNSKCFELVEHLKKLPTGGTSIIYDNININYEAIINNAIETYYVEAPSYIPS